jgi:anti-sigma-K factor RskA
MSDTSSPMSPDDMDQAAAAEYVLGVQNLAERSATEARIRTDPEFAAMVTAWEFRLSDMNDAYADAKAPNLLPALEARLFPKADAPAPAKEAYKIKMNPLRWLTGMALAASLVIIGLTVVLPPKPDLVAVLATQDARLAYEVRAFNGKLTITRVSGVPAVEGQVHELWVIAPNAAPVSLGLLQDRPLVIDNPVPTEAVDWLFAVSVEPTGGSPSGVPTGPVILTGQVGKSDA